MALSSIGVLRTTSLFKASCLDVNGSNWALQNSCSLPPDSASTTYSIGGLKFSTLRRSCVVCSAVQESSTPTVSAEKEEAKTVKKEAGAAPAPASKPKPAAKAPVKPLPQMMEEDIIPTLRSTLEAQEDISELELSFLDDRLEGSFVKNGYPYTFWAFFPTGLIGPKGFSLAAYGNGPSTVEPFLIDEKKITAKHVVFWVEKRLAAQGIIPVWSDE